MDGNKIYEKAKVLIGETYGETGYPESGSVTVENDGILYKVYFEKKETGFICTRII